MNTSWEKCRRFYCDNNTEELPFNNTEVEFQGRWEVRVKLRCGTLFVCFLCMLENRTSPGHVLITMTPTSNSGKISPWWVKTVALEAVLWCSVRGLGPKLRTQDTHRWKLKMGMNHGRGCDGHLVRMKPCRRRRAVWSQRADFESWPGKSSNFSCLTASYEKLRVPVPTSGGYWE